MTIAIRLLGAGDDSVLADVAPSVFDDSLDRAATRAFLADPRHHLAVALEDATVIGFVSAVHYFHPDKSRPEMWINEVGVAPTHQGRGVGRALMDAMLAEGRRLGVAEGWVLTERNNEAAMQLYRAAGGEEGPPDPVIFNFSSGHEPGRAGRGRRAGPNASS